VVDNNKKLKITPQQQAGFFMDMNPDRRQAYPNLDLLNQFGIPVPVPQGLHSPHRERNMDAYALRYIYGCAIQGYIALIRKIGGLDFQELILSVENLPTPQNVTKKEARRFIDTIAKTLPVISSPDVEDSNVAQQQALSVTGLTALGILRTLAVTDDEEVRILKNTLTLLKTDPAAFKIYRQNPDLFDGHMVVQDILSGMDQHSWQNLKQGGKGNDYVKG